MPLLQLYKFNLVSAYGSIDLFSMKSFKALMFLTLAAALSCGANGSPTNATSDGFIKRQNKQELTTIVNSLQTVAAQIFKDNRKYADFTKAFVIKLGDNNKHYNYVVCYNTYDYKFDGKQGQDWVQTSISDPYSSDYEGDPPVTFDVVVGGAGTFTRHGKAGYANWAWNGAVAKKQDLHSNFVTFLNPVTGNAHQIGGD